MSALATSSLPNAVNANTQTASKNAAKTSASEFLAVLGASAGGVFAQGDVSNVGGALVKTVFEDKKKDVLPEQPSTQAIADVKKPKDIEQPQDKNVNNPADIVAKPKRENAPEKKPDAPQEVNNNQPETTQEKPEAVVATNNAPENANDSSLAELSEKITAKIQELSSLLASIIGFFQPQNNTQLTAVQVRVDIRAIGTDVNATNNALTQGLQLVPSQLDQLISSAGTALNNPFANALGGNAALSDMFKALQNTTQLVSQSTQFQSISFNVSAWQQLSVGFENELSASQFLSMQENFSGDASLQGADFSKLTDLFAKLEQSLGDLKSLLAAHAKNATTVVVDNHAGVTVSNASLPLQNGAASASADAAIPSQMLAVSGIQTVPVNVVNSPAVAVEAKANLGGNTSGGNNSGQGGDKAFAPTALSATSASQGSAQTATNSFSKILEQAKTAVPAHEQVTVQIKNLSKNNGSKIEIQLDPESLGKVRIEVKLDAAGKASLVVTADHKSTLELLQRDASNLQRALSDAGFKTDGGTMDFNLRGGNQQKEQQASHTYKKFQPEDEDELAVLSVVTRNYTIHRHDGLNIEI